VIISACLQCATVAAAGTPAGVVADSGAPHVLTPAESAQIATRAPDQDESLFAGPTTADHIGRVVVPVKINGRGPYRFVVDTGANHSTISSDLVRTLGLIPGQEASVILDGITGSAQVSYVPIDRLQAGDLTLEDTMLPIVAAQVMAGADGILGAAGMAHKSLLIDFRRNRVAIAPFLDPSARTDAIKIHAARVTSGLIALETEVGGVRTLAVLDTGSERTLGNLALRDALRGKRRATQGFVASVTSVYGATKEVEQGEIRAAPLIAIDSLRITNATIVFGGFHIFKVWHLVDRPTLILGMDILGTVPSLSIDFRNQDVYVGNARVTGTDLNARGNLGDQSQRK